MRMFSFHARRIAVTAALSATAGLLSACGPDHTPLGSANAAAQQPAPPLPPSAPASSPPPTFPPASGPASGPASSPIR